MDTSAPRTHPVAVELLSRRSMGIATSARESAFLMPECNAAKLASVPEPPTANPADTTLNPLILCV